MGLIGKTYLGQKVVCVSSCSLKELLKPVWLIFVTMIDECAPQELLVIIVGTPAGSVSSREPHTGKECSGKL